MPYIEIENQALHYQLRRSIKAKRLHMTVRHLTFEVVAPVRTSNLQILAFIYGLKKWMLKHHAQKKIVASPLIQNWPSHFTDGTMLTFRGQQIVLNLQIGKVFSSELKADHLQLTLVANKKYLTDPARWVKKQLLQWYHQQALKIIQKNIEYYGPIINRWPTSYRLKQQKTRWGSCGIQNNININWLLILAPEGVLEYVVVHELCHLIHRNHGKRFWAKVAHCMPHYAQYEKWLKNHGHWLQQDMGHLKC